MQYKLWDLSVNILHYISITLLNKTTIFHLLTCVLMGGDNGTILGWNVLQWKKKSQYDWRLPNKTDLVNPFKIHKLFL